MEPTRDEFHQWSKGKQARWIKLNSKLKTPKPGVERFVVNKSNKYIIVWKVNDYLRMDIQTLDWEEGISKMLYEYEFRYMEKARNVAPSMDEFNAWTLEQKSMWIETVNDLYGQTEPGAVRSPEAPRFHVFESLGCGIQYYTNSRDKVLTAEALPIDEIRDKIGQYGLAVSGARKLIDN